MNFRISPEAIQKYVIRRQEDLQNLKTAIEKMDFASLRQIAHQIKGSAATFGFGDLGNKAGTLEEHALEENAPAVKDDIHWIENWLKENLPA